MPSGSKKSWMATTFDDVCGWCLHVYVYEQRYHCERCDEPVCPTCVVVERELSLTLCPDCAERHADAQDDTQDDAGSENQ